MITHEEALETLKNIMSSLVGTDANYIGNHFNADRLLEYINQQQAQEERVKKTEELVKLYKSVHGVVQSWDTMPDIQSKIDKLEKELNL